MLSHGGCRLGLAQAAGPRRWLLWGYGGALLFLFAVLLVAPGVARAADTLDQSQTQVTVGFPVYGPIAPNGSSETQSWAQTFTAGVTGGLDRVDLNLSDLNSPRAPLIVEITNTSGGLPGSTVLATASVPASSMTSSEGWVEVDFASPAPVVSGTQYAIVAYTANTAPNSGYVLGGGGAYAGGTAFSSNSSPPAGWAGSSSNLAFQTYVQPSVSTQAAKLVSDSTGKPPGTALVDKATAIQTAVNTPGQTATACAGITDYLGLVNAQIGKHLTQAQATLLTTDATTLSSSLRCS